MITLKYNSDGKFAILPYFTEDSDCSSFSIARDMEEYHTQIQSDFLLDYNESILSKDFLDFIAYNKDSSNNDNMKSKSNLKTTLEAFALDNMIYISRLKMLIFYIRSLFPFYNVFSFQEYQIKLNNPYYTIERLQEEAIVLGVSLYLTENKDIIIHGLDISLHQNRMIYTIANIEVFKLMVRLNEIVQDNEEYAYFTNNLTLHEDAIIEYKNPYNISTKIGYTDNKKKYVSCLVKAGIDRYQNLLLSDSEKDISKALSYIKQDFIKLIQQAVIKYKDV